MSEIIVEVIDLLKQTFSNMPWSGLAVLFAVAVIIRILDGGKFPKLRRVPQRSRGEDEDDEFELVVVRRKKR